MLGFASPALLVFLVAGGRLGTGAFAILATVFPAALIALAGGRRARRAAVVLAVLLAGGAVLMLALAGSGRVGGLPGSAWAMFGALWAWPLIVTMWAYAAWFRADGQGPPEGGGG